MTYFQEKSEVKWKKKKKKKKKRRLSEKDKKIYKYFQKKRKIILTEKGRTFCFIIDIFQKQGKTILKDPHALRKHACSNILKILYHQKMKIFR